MTVERGVIYRRRLQVQLSATLMSEQFTIYRETGDVLFPEERSRQPESPPEYFDTLSLDYVDLYVDTGVPELLL